MTEYITTEQEKQRNKSFIRQYLIPCIPQIFNAMLILQHDYSIILHIISTLLFIAAIDKTNKSADGDSNMVAALIFPFFLLPLGFIIFLCGSFLLYLVFKK